MREISSLNWTNCIRGVIPHQIMVAFFDHAAYTGNYKQNPFAFENFGIQKMNPKINGTIHPETPYNIKVSLLGLSTNLNQA